MTSRMLLLTRMRGWRYKIMNRLSYARLTFQSLIINDEVHAGFAHVNGASVVGPRMGALRFLYEEIILGELYSPTFKREGMTIVDCGANIGVASVYFATTLPGCRIIAYEPNPEAFSYLKLNAAQFASGKITAVEAAVAASEGTLRLYSSHAKASMRSSIIADRSNTDRSFQVTSVRLSSILAELEEVDLVKLDIEGAEVIVLAELAQSELLAKPREYVVEFHNFVTGKHRIGEFITAFEAIGYRVSMEAGRARVDEYQDVIVRAARLA